VLHHKPWRSTLSLRIACIPKKLKRIPMLKMRKEKKRQQKMG